MKRRSVVGVLILSIVTFGIYILYWAVSTKDEMNRRGAQIPTAWLLLVPLVNIWWQWKYCEGVELVTRKELTQVISFILLFLLGIIGIAIIQSKLNSVPEVDLAQAQAIAS